MESSDLHVHLSLWHAAQSILGTALCCSSSALDTALHCCSITVECVLRSLAAVAARQRSTLWARQWRVRVVGRVGCGAGGLYCVPGAE